VGIDWLSLSGEYDTSTGLEITTVDGCCYAMNLYEKYRGQGIGLTLLSASLEAGRRRGCTAQVTIVEESNTRMMSVATQVFGFRQIGSIRTRRVLGKASSTWKKDGQEQRKATVLLPAMLLSCEYWDVLRTLIADNLSPLL
jgi:GNAT superfamily N-acetyltransferase